MPNATKSQMDTIELRKNDHETGSSLFKKIEAVAELKVHPELEEQTLYPAVYDDVQDEDLMNEVEEEHHVALVLIAELDKAAAAVDRLEAKFKVLVENFRRQLREERGKLLPCVEESGVDLDELWQQMMLMKQEP